MLLESLLPNLPSSMTELWVYIAAFLGAVLLTYGVFLELEKRQDLVLFLAGAFLFVYALYIQNIIFMIAMIGLMTASAVEFIEIYVGLHKHNKDDLKRYKNMR